MTEIKLGQKIQCSECETRFYDLGKPQAACPKCGKIYVDADEMPVKPPVASSRSRLQRVDPDRGDDDDEDALLDTDDDAGAVELDDDDLDDDEDDLDDEDDDED